jgi:cobalt/nickel transport system permease protein
VKISPPTSRIAAHLFIPLCALHITASHAYGMHISEGILPLPWAVFWFVVAAPFIALGLHRLNRSSKDNLSFKPLVGFMAAAVFIISCIPIPVPTAGTCSHPCGAAISAILLGPAISVLVAAVALMIQALFLGHGGLSTLGANIISMGVIGSFSGFLVFRVFRSARASLSVSAFVAGLVADWATYFSTSCILASGLKGNGPFLPLLWKIAVAFVPTQLPLGILEGAITAGMVVLLHRKRPDLLVRMKIIKAEEAGV